MRKKKNLSWACTNQAAKQEVTYMHQHSSRKEQASALGTTAHESQQASLYEQASVEVGFFPHVWAWPPKTD